MLTASRLRTAGVVAFAAALLLVTMQVARADSHEPPQIKVCATSFFFFGSVRFVDPATNCFGWEQSVTWNQQGVQGEQGIQGEQGEQGEPGDDGAPGGLSGHEIVLGTQSNVWETRPGGGDQVQIVNALCPVGKVVVGGGFHADAMGGTNLQNELEENISVHRSYPITNGGAGSNQHGWEVRAKLLPGANTLPPANAYLRAYAICATAVAPI